MGEGNAISTEAIAIHTITNIILWSFSVLCITQSDGLTTGTGMELESTMYSVIYVGGSSTHSFFDVINCSATIMIFCILAL